MATAVDYPFNPDYVADDTEQNRIATDERHASLPISRPELVKQWSLPHLTGPRSDLSYEGGRPRRTVLRDVLGDSIEVRFDEAGQLDPHYDRAWSARA